MPGIADVIRRYAGICGHDFGFVQEMLKKHRNISISFESYGDFEFYSFAFENILNFMRHPISGKILKKTLFFTQKALVENLFY